MAESSSLTGNWSFPTSMRVGAGRIRELPGVCRELGISRPLLVTDPGLAGLGMLTDAVSRNEEAGLPTVVYSDVRGNPVAANVEEGVRRYRDGGHDGIIAFGGGSALDAGKAVAFMVAQTRPMWDFEDIGDNWKAANAEGIARVIAVPTTAGTGSEVGRASVILNVETHTKKVIFHPRMLPAVVISDPGLTVGLPAHITAATGMDALAHCLEAFCAPSWHPMAAGIAVEGMRLINRWLPVAVRDGTNLEARANMLVAASMGATAFQKGLGAIHALSHPIGAIYDTHHGLTNAVVMPYVLAFNRPAIEGRMARLAAWLDLPSASFDAVIDRVLALRSELGIAHTLADLGVGEDRIDELAEMAVVDPTAGGNPVPLDVPGLRRLFEACIRGNMP